jgi:hypothetical protein
LLDTFKARLNAIERIDFFGSAGRDRVLALLAQLEERNKARTTIAPPSVDEARMRAGFLGRIWVTRPRPGVDRMASAWLIRRFIDPQARFGFASDRQSTPEGTVPFDMFGVEFSHRGDACTFETLCSDFGLADPALLRIAAIVHDLDLKDGRYSASECSAVDAMIEGLQLAHEEDDALLTQGMTMFEALYRSFERHSRLAGPRPVARSGRRGARRQTPRKRRKS